MMLYQRDDDATPAGHSMKDDGSIQQIQRNSYKMQKIIVRKLKKIQRKMIRLDKIQRTCEFNKIHNNNQKYQDKVKYSDNNTLNHHDHHHHHHEQQRNDTANGNQTCDEGRGGGGTTDSEKKDNLKALQTWKDLLLTLRWMLLMMMLMTAMLTIPVIVVIAIITTMLQRIQK